MGDGKCEMGNGRSVRALLLLLSWASGTLLVHQCWGLLALALAFAGVGIGIGVCWCWVGICWCCVCCHWHWQELGGGSCERWCWCLADSSSIPHLSSVAHSLSISNSPSISHSLSIPDSSSVPTHHLLWLWGWMVLHGVAAEGVKEAHRGGVGPRLCMWGADQRWAILIVENLIVSKT